MLAILRRGVWVLAAISCTLNIYIYAYPFLHRCSFAPHASLKLLAFGDPQITGAGQNTPLRKRIDIAGNDLFLKHTVASLSRWLDPDAIFVMGDLISSQWISTEEFDARAIRFSEIFPKKLGPIYNLSGNHDIGYHGEMTTERVERYERRYGQVNYCQLLNAGTRLVAINSLAIDGPPYDEYHTQVHEFVDGLAEFDGLTILLTHVPLYKPQGICRDGPMFSYYESGDIKSQNHLSEESSRKLLRLLNGKGVVLAGHDHEGCLASYRVDGGDLHIERGLVPGNIPEITVRSLMGEYGGNGGLLSVLEGGEIEFSLCRFQVQHLWWVTTVVTYITLGLAAATTALSVLF